MSWRTKINGHEWLGNNKMYDEIAEELIRQGCPDPREENTIENFEIKDINALIKASEKVVRRMFEKDNSMADFREEMQYYTTGSKVSLTMNLLLLNRGAYIFIPVSLLNYIGKKNEDYTIDLENGEIVFNLTEKGKCIFEWW